MLRKVFLSDYPFQGSIVVIEGGRLPIRSLHHFWNSKNQYFDKNSMSRPHHFVLNITYFASHGEKFDRIGQKIPLI